MENPKIPIWRRTYSVVFEDKNLIHIDAKLFERESELVSS